VVTQPGQTDQEQAQNPEQEALAALHAHRQQSGYTPWDNGDNEHLRTLDKKQQRQTRERREILEGQAAYQQRAIRPAARFERVPDALSQVTFTPHSIESEENQSVGPVDRPEPAHENEPGVLTIRIDPELARVAVGLERTGEYWVWSLGRHFFGVPGCTTREQLFEKVQATGVIQSRRHLNRILKLGKDLFWGLDEHGHVYLRGYVKVADQLTHIAVDTCPQLVETNLPGARDVHIPVGSSLGDFKAQVYAGWLAYRQNPKIARQTLATLFNCTPETLRNWEGTLGGQIRVVTNYGQTSLNPKEHDDVIDYLPGHQYCYVTRQGEMRLRWRQPNTYQTCGIREHAHKGQSRKARTYAARTAWYQPVESGAPPHPSSLKRLPFDRSHRVPKQYYESDELLRRHLKRLAKKGKPGITPATPRYVYLGEDRNQHGIWELSLDGWVYTKANERLSIKAEKMWWKGWQARLDIARRLAAAS
jgi:hypothetical protein